MSYVRYIDKTREYYLSEGYDNPYKWAHFDDVPFAELKKPLSECCLTLVSTSDVAIRSEDDDKDPTHNFLVGSVYSIPSDTNVADLYSRQEHYDKYATNLDDVNSYFPITRLQELVAAGKLKSLAARFHGVYTNYSQRRTLEVDAPEVLKRCREDKVDIALFTPV
ncbi:MAG: hypothetical protein V2J25_05015 [Desulfatiglans sp.]|jgi:hypothetical protein|nr:hypothetical protein [Thermodesulfobacteriota bacterium]MEE4352213.1 hypothetical protein [Desulfatiglans sp.]